MQDLALHRRIVGQLKKEAVFKSTREKYQAAWTGLLKMSRYWGIHPEEAIMPYLAYLYQKNQAPSYIASQCAGIRFIYKEKFKKDLPHQEEVTKALRGIRRKGKIPRELVTISVDQCSKVFKIIDCLARTKYESRLFSAAVFLMFYGLCRSGEVTDTSHAIRFGDVELGEDKLIIGFRSHKSLMRTSQKQLVRIPLRGSTVPLYHLARYMEVRLPPASVSECLMIDHKGKPMLKSALRAFMAKVHGIVLSNHKPNLHAYRRGGASHLFRIGADYNDIKVLGRWKGEGHLRYIRL